MVVVTKIGGEIGVSGSVRLGSELITVGHIAGIAGNNEAFDFSTVIIMNGRRKVVN